MLTDSVVEPFHCDPAPASQDSDSSSSTVVFNFLLEKNSLNFHFLIYRGLFIHRKVRVHCFALPVLHLKGKINLLPVHEWLQFFISFL